MGLSEHKKYIVYCITNKINNKKYIGITCQPFEQRHRYGKGYKKAQEVFYRAIQKYGWDNFEHEILFENLTMLEAKNKEVELIKEYNTYIHSENSNGYNMTTGGEGKSGAKMSKETKVKIWENRSHIVTKETREKISKANKGRHQSEETKRKISESNKGKKKSREHIEKLIEARKKPNWMSDEAKQRATLRIIEAAKRNRKKVMCDGIIYDSVKECSEYYSININTMRSWLNGGNKMNDFFISLGLRYLTELEEEENE